MSKNIVTAQNARSGSGAGNCFEKQDLSFVTILKLSLLINELKNKQIK